MCYINIRGGKMKVILGCLNSKFIHASLAPWCLKAGIEEYCYGNIFANVFESTINSDCDEDILKISNQNLHK